MATHGALVLAAGRGTRMNSRTPKVLHRICGKEMVALVVAAAHQAGLGRILVVVPSESQPFHDVLSSSVDYAVQGEPLGSGDAVLRARSTVRGLQSIVVLSGDVPLILPETLTKLKRLHEEREACITMLTARNVNPDGLGRVVRTDSGAITAVVEEEQADEETVSITEINAGVYCFRGAWLWENLEMLKPSPRGELLLTDLIEAAAQQGMTVESVSSKCPEETLGINNRVQLAEAEATLRRRLLERWMMGGVTMPDPYSVYIDSDSEFGQDTVLLPNTHITGASRVGERCEIGPNSVVRDSIIGDGCRITSSVVDGSTLEKDVDVGPFSNIRGGCHLGAGVHIGTSVEIKNSRIGPGTASGHFSYIGDADLGAKVNIGAGTVTCNYDGEKKNKTYIGDGAFIGCDTMLIAPVTIGARSWTGAGAVVTKDVPPDSLAVGVPAKISPRNGEGKAQ